MHPYHFKLILVTIRSRAPALRSSCSHLGCGGGGGGSSSSSSIRTSGAGVPCAAGRQGLRAWLLLAAFAREEALARPRIWLFHWELRRMGGEGERAGEWKCKLLLFSDHSTELCCRNSRLLHSLWTSQSIFSWTQTWAKTKTQTWATFSSHRTKKKKF